MRGVRGVKGRQGVQGMHAPCLGQLPPVRQLPPVKVMRRGGRQAFPQHRAPSPAALHCLLPTWKICSALSSWPFLP